MACSQVVKPILEDSMRVAEDSLFLSNYQASWEDSMPRTELKEALT